MLVGIRPGDAAHIDHEGLVYTSQNENDAGNMAFYEVQNTGDYLIFDIREYVGGFERPIITLHTHWGDVDFTLYDQVDGDVILDEVSGYSPDKWMVDVTATSGRLSVTEFDTDAGADGTQAGWLPYITIQDLKV